MSASKKRDLTPFASYANASRFALVDWGPHAMPHIAIWAYAIYSDKVGTVVHETIMCADMCAYMGAVPCLIMLQLAFLAAPVADLTPRHPVSHTKARPPINIL